MKRHRTGRTTRIMLETDTKTASDAFRFAENAACSLISLSILCGEVLEHDR
ncbi:hypothetical protein B0H98_1054 [Vreelandella songnenensis]|uniref:Uncharacterized protein n=1 Tax=Vreelandella songnenensis TaxID=1176243 RepID=A0A2T0V2R1_9GAMM|nr:hypothetical protein B0H98_1054 [Halomonas songnenensis]